MDADLLDHWVYDCDGGLVGSVIGVYSDVTGRSAWLLVSIGMFGLRTAVVPIRGAVMWGDDVVVAHDRRTIVDAPVADVVVTIEPDDEVVLTQHYAKRCNPFRPVPPSESSS